MLDDYSGTLSEYEAKQVLDDAGISVVEAYLAADPDEAVAYADRLGYPVMLKADSRDIQHKSDIGAVKDAHDEDEVRTRHQVIMDNVADQYAELNGILVEEHAAGQELIIGVHRDPDFGHVIMFGLGGIFVEVLRDVHFRALPITRDDAEDLIREMETRELLDGIRGQEPVDTGAIIDMLLAVSDLVTEHPNIAELDINPLFADADGAVAADALIRVEDDE